MNIHEELNKFITKKDLEVLDFNIKLSTLGEDMVRQDGESEKKHVQRLNMFLNKLNNTINEFKCIEVNKKQVFEIIRCSCMDSETYGKVMDFS